MNKIIIFYGSSRAYEKLIPKDHRNLTDVVMEIDSDNREFVMVVKGFPTDSVDAAMDDDTKLFVKNFVIYSDEYCGVREHVITNFINFIGQMEIENMYLQNPPWRIIKQLRRVYGECDIIEEKSQEYENISVKTIQSIYDNYEDNIIGQQNVKKQLLQSLYPLTLKDRTKPVVILFYGESGIGKTETAQYLAKLLKGKLFRKQFSMFQNNEFATYLFGGKHTEDSFAKDLLDRESNVILLDEFDKAYPVFHSAFYQLFDEGIYKDKNYFVDLNKTLIICTSNYTSLDEVRKNLGDPIYNRFDSVIHFENLSNDAKVKIADRAIKETFSKFDMDSDDVSDNVVNQIKNCAVKCSNARAIKRLVEETFSLIAIRKICR